MAPRAGLQRNAAVSERGPASAPCFCRGCGAPLGPRACSSGPSATYTNCCVIAQIPDPWRTGEDRPTPERPIPVGALSATAPDHGQRSQPKHTPTPESTPRPAQTAHPPRPSAAVAQDLPHEADAREEDGPEPAHPPVDPHAHGQQDPLELEAAALAPHEARLVESLPKKTCSS